MAASALLHTVYILSCMSFIISGRLAVCLAGRGERSAGRFSLLLGLAETALVDRSLQIPLFRWGRSADMAMDWFLLF